MHKIPPASVKQEEFFIIMSIKSQKFRQFGILCTV